MYNENLCSEVPIVSLALCIRLRLYIMAHSISQISLTHCKALNECSEVDFVASIINNLFNSWDFTQDIILGVVNFLYDKT